MKFYPVEQQMKIERAGNWLPSAESGRPHLMFPLRSQRPKFTKNYYEDYMLVERYDILLFRLFANRDP